MDVRDMNCSSSCTVRFALHSAAFATQDVGQYLPASLRNLRPVMIVVVDARMFDDGITVKYRRTQYLSKRP